MLLFLCSETIEFNFIKLDTRCSVILPPTVSFLWSNLSCIRMNDEKDGHEQRLKICRDEMYTQK